MKFWMVWNENGRAPMYKHPNENSARAEAARLAECARGQVFIVLEATAMVRVPLPQQEWTELESAEEIPF